MGLLWHGAQPITELGSGGALTHELLVVETLGGDSFLFKRIHVSDFVDLNVSHFLENDCIGTDHLQDSSVTAIKVASGAITYGKIANAAIDQYAVMDGEIVWSKLAPAVQNLINNQTNIATNLTNHIAGTEGRHAAAHIDVDVSGTPEDLQTVLEGLFDLILGEWHSNIVLENVEVSAGTNAVDNTRYFDIKYTTLDSELIDNISLEGGWIRIGITPTRAIRRFYIHSFQFEHDEEENEYIFTARILIPSQYVHDGGEGWEMFFRLRPRYYWASGNESDNIYSFSDKGIAIPDRIGLPEEDSSLVNLLSAEVVKKLNFVIDYETLSISGTDHNVVKSIKVVQRR